MKVVCEHCGLPFSVGRVEPGRALYCCSGCALAARVTADAGGTRVVNAAWVTALGVGFAFFNQVLSWLLAVSLARHETTQGWATAGSLTWASLALGVGVWLALVFFLLRSGAPRRGVDIVVLVATGGLIVCAVAGGSAGGAVAGNAALA
ncbi:MAG: hypothetical protein H7067_09735, partial [Burkholderiales bacterium]|nr:hypothetical protein [Opitutaceae bacterium]